MNEYGIFTFQGHEILVEQLMPPHVHGDITVEARSDEGVAYCRHCAHGHCHNDIRLWSQVRQRAYIQFCLPVDGGEGSVTSLDAWSFLAKLTKDPRIFTIWSWPKGLPVPETEDLRVYHGSANSKEARTYIPGEDLEEYEHHKSVGRAMTHEVRSGATVAELLQAPWLLAAKEWSEVCDYHLLRPRLPEAFLGRASKTIVIGVFQRDFVGHGGYNLQRSVLENAKVAGFPKAFPVDAKEKRSKGYMGSNAGDGMTRKKIEETEFRGGAERTREECREGERVVSKTTT